MCYLCVCVCVCLRVSQDVVTPPSEPSLPAAGSSPVLLLLSHRRSFHLPEQVPGAAVQSFSCLQQPLSRCVQPPQPLREGSQSQRQLSLLPGALNLPAVAIGMLLGGVIMKRVGLTLKTIPRFSVVMLTASTLLCIPLFFMGCHTHHVTEVNHLRG